MVLGEVMIDGRCFGIVASNATFEDDGRLLEADCRLILTAPMCASAEQPEPPEHKISTNHLGETWLISRAEGQVDFQDCERIRSLEPKEWR